MNKHKSIDTNNSFNSSTGMAVCSVESDVRRVHRALNAVLSSNSFKKSPKMSAFLSYVVQEKIAGYSDRIKAYSVGVDALGKPPTFDPQSDPSVRVLANRLRSAMKRYYTSYPEQELFIELYRGSYVPHFIDHRGVEIIQFNGAENVAKPADGLDGEFITKPVRH